jgi:tetratricopeptide (TPR) repeat protein
MFCKFFIFATVLKRIKPKSLNMKRIFFLIVFVIAGMINVIAQSSDGTNPSQNTAALEKKMQKSDQSIQDPKKGSDPKTWVDRAKLFEDIYESNTQFLRNGMPLTELKILFKEPKEIKKVEVAGAPVEQYVYDRISINLDNGTVKSWEETKTIFPDPLKEALNSYNKAIELDKDGKVKKKITEGLKELKAKFEKEALNEYNLKNFSKSYEGFKSMVEINENSLVNIADTAIVYYTGVTANEAGKPTEAIPYLNKAISMNYNAPLMYLDLNKAYIALGDSTQALTALQKGNQKYPENVSILIELINYYLVKGHSTEALEYLSKAKNNDPNNKSFYFAEGVLYDKMGEMDKSIAAYNKSIELDPTYFDAYYNAAVVYYNYGVKLLEEAQNEKDNNKYIEKKAASEAEFKKAIPYMEKASEINPKDASSLETLKSLYYRLRINDKLEQVNQKLKELKG